MNFNSFDRETNVIEAVLASFQLKFLSISANGQSEMYKMDIPRLKVEFTGTGDLYAALLLAWMYHHPDNLKVCYVIVLLSLLDVCM